MTSWFDGLRDRAGALVPERILEYVDHGAADPTAAAEAPSAWAAVRFRPRIFQDVTAVDLATEFLDIQARVPWGIAPSTLQRRIHPHGEVAMAAAAAEAGSPMVVSSNAGSTFADIAATGVDFWVQCYVTQDRELCLPLLERAVAAGARGIVLTVDTPVVSTKHTASGRPVWELVPADELRVNFDAGHDDRPGAEKAGDLSAADVVWLAERTGLPVVLKGVLRGDDAELAVHAGAAAVWVSNHGGRQLGRAIPTAHALPEVAAAVAGRVPVYVDGGLRTPLDLLAAFALGADACFLGRLPLWALAQGEDGLRELHHRLHRDLTEALMLVGAPDPRAARGTATDTSQGL